MREFLSEYVRDLSPPRVKTWTVKLARVMMLNVSLTLPGLIALPLCPASAGARGACRRIQDRRAGRILLPLKEYSKDQGA